MHRAVAGSLGVSWRFNDGSTSMTNPVGANMNESRTLVAEFAPEAAAAIGARFAIAQLRMRARRGRQPRRHMGSR